MNTEEVTAMIDAISDGEPWTLKIDEATNLNFNAEGFNFTDETGDELIAGISDVRLAREIAVGLVAWANKQQGRIPAGEQAIRPIEISHALWRSSGKLRRKVREGAWRKEWYARNAERMTIPTLEENLRIMKSLLTSLSANAIDSDAEYNDMVDAMTIAKTELIKKRGE